jgi:hypothetical protein
MPSSDGDEKNECFKSLFGIRFETALANPYPCPYCQGAMFYSFASMKPILVSLRQLTSFKFFGGDELEASGTVGWLARTFLSYHDDVLRHFTLEEYGFRSFALAPV